MQTALQQQQLPLLRWRALIHKCAEDPTLLSSHLSVSVHPCQLAPITHTNTHAYIQHNRKSYGFDYRTDKSTDKSKLQSRAPVLDGVGLGLTFSNFIIYFWVYSLDTYPCTTHRYHCTPSWLFLHCCFCASVTSGAFSPVLHARALIWRNVSEHNEQAGQGTVSLQCRQIQTHRLHSSSQTTWKEVRERERQRASHGVRLGNTSAAYQLQLLALLPLLPWQRGTVRHPGGRDGPKNLQLSLTSGEREGKTELEPVYAAWLLHHFTSQGRC